MNAENNTFLVLGNDLKYSTLFFGRENPGLKALAIFNLNFFFFFQACGFSKLPKLRVSKGQGVLNLCQNSISTAQLKSIFTIGQN